MSHCVSGPYANTIFLVCSNAIPASKMLNYVVIWIVPMLSVLLLPSVLKSSFSNSVFCLSDSPLPQSNQITSSKVGRFAVESWR